MAEYPVVATDDEENFTELETKAPAMSFNEHEVSSVIKFCTCMHVNILH